jgi:hypothetical protein
VSSGLILSPTLIFHTSYCNLHLGVFGILTQLLTISLQNDFSVSYHLTIKFGLGSFIILVTFKKKKKKKKEEEEEEEE